MAHAHRPTRTRAADAFDTLRRVTKTPVTHLATNVLETSRTTAHCKLNGSTPLTFDEIDLLADYFNVPVTLFLMERAEILAWMAASGWSDQAEESFGCIIELAAAA